MARHDADALVTGVQTMDAVVDNAFTDFRRVARYRELRIGFSPSGDAAWWSAILDDLAEWDGKPTGWKDTRWTGVLEKRNDTWLIVQMHFSFASDKVRAETLESIKKQAAAARK